jgi:hypothetical protein
MSNLGRAKNAVLKKLPGDLVTRNGQESFVLRQWNVAAMDVKERQVTGTGAGAVAANIVPQACTCMTGLCGRQGQRWQYGDADKNPKNPMAGLLPHCLNIYLDRGLKSTGLLRYKKCPILGGVHILYSTRD